MLVLGIGDRVATHKLVQMAAAAIAARVNGEGRVCFGANGNGFVTVAPQPSVFGTVVFGIGGIDFYHIAVFVAGQPENVALAEEVVAVKNKRHGSRGKRRAVGINGFGNLYLEVFFGAQNRTPRGGSTGTVSEGTNDSIAQTVVVALFVGFVENGNGRAGSSQIAIAQAGNTGNPTLAGLGRSLPNTFGRSLQKNNTNALIF